MKSQVNTPPILIAPIAAGLGLYLLTKSLTAILYSFLSRQEFNTEIESKIFSVDFEFFIYGAIIGPALEEFFFRKFLFLRLSKYSGKLGGATISMLLFVLLHKPELTSVYVGNIILLAILCQYIFIVTGRIFLSMLVHSTYNTLALLPKPSISWFLESLHASEDWLKFCTLVTVLIIGVNLILASVRILRRIESQAQYL